MQQNNGMSRAAAMAYRVLIRRGVSALPVHPLEILSRAATRSSGRM